MKLNFPMQTKYTNLEDSCSNFRQQLSDSQRDHVVVVDALPEDI